MNAHTPAEHLPRLTKPMPTAPQATVGQRFLRQAAFLGASMLLAATCSADAENSEARGNATQLVSAQEQERPRVRPGTTRTRPATEARTGASDLRAALDSPEIQLQLSRKVRGVRVTREDLDAAASASPEIGSVTLFDPQADRPALSAQQIQGLRTRARPDPAAGANSITPDIARATLASQIGSGVSATTSIRPDRVRPNLPPRLDIASFGEDLHAALAANVAGYAMQLRLNGETVYTLQWNWASYPQDQGLGWNPQRRMHIASVSKLITSIAMTKALDEKGISYEASIADHLPAYWTQHAAIRNISFRHLMTNSSGFKIDSSDQSFGFMKTWIANGPTIAVGTRDYENFNFGLQRILIATVAGYIDPDADFGALNDLFWNVITNSAYMDYVNKKVFAPSGVSGPSLAKPSNPVRAYGFPPSGQGWNSGNLAEQSGGVAWHMSIDEILKVMSALRRGAAIMPQTKAQGLLNAGFGLDSPAGGATSPAGKIYHKNGAWGDATRTEQCVIFFLPGNIELAVFVNSRVSSNNTFLRGLVMGVYESNLVEP